MKLVPVLRVYNSLRRLWLSPTTLTINLPAPRIPITLELCSRPITVWQDLRGVMQKTSPSGGIMRR